VPLISRGFSKQPHALNHLPCCGFPAAKLYNLSALIQDEERHAHFLEAQLHSIKEVGIANYLAQQLHSEK
jgi:hypothetical protein